MSDPELATKAPESDLAMDTQNNQGQTQTQPSLISNTDSLAQTGPTMGEHCTTDRPLPPNSARPSGELTTLSNGSIETYISKPADYPQTPGKLLLLLSGGTGIRSINNQLQADLWAAKGFVVVMPDQFDKDVVPGPSTAAIASSTGEETGDGSSGGGIGGFIEQVKLKAAEAAKSFVLDMWLARQTSEKVLPRLRRVVEAVKDEYADAIANGGGIYAAGYCFGAKYVLVLAGENAEAELAGADDGKKAGDEETMVGGRGKDASGSVIKAGTIAHGTLITREDLLKIAAPVSMVCVENDSLFPEEILDVGRKHLATTTIDHEIKVYSGVPHGFAVVGEYQDAKIVEAQTSAFDQMVNWLQSH